MRKIKLVIVDLYGVIALGNYHNICQYLAKKYQQKEEDIYRVVYHKYFEKAVSGKISEEDSFRLTIKELGFQENWRKIREKHLNFVNKPNIRVINFFSKIQTRGVIIVLLSKNTPYQFKETVSRLKLKKHFTNIINTHDIKLQKGSVETIKYLSKKFNVTPSEMIFVDDQEFNLKNAKTMGVKTILYKDFPTVRKEILDLSSF